MCARPTFLAVLVVLLALAGCGADEGVDHGNPQAVFRAALRAAYDGDWAALEGLLTKDARFALERDMRRLQANLASPRPGSELHARVRDALGERYEAAVAALAEGGVGDVLRFYVRTWPRAREPEPRGMKVQPLAIEFLYEAHGGVLRPVKLVQVGGRWLVQELHL